MLPWKLSRKNQIRCFLKKQHENRRQLFIAFIQFFETSRQQFKLCRKYFHHHQLL